MILKFYVDLMKTLMTFEVIFFYYYICNLQMLAFIEYFVKIGS